MTALIDTWSHDATEEDGMTDEHAWIWREMINRIPQQDLSTARILDVGCNQGGFLRMLYDRHPFASGVGVDIARDRVALANAAKGARPLDYVATNTYESLGAPFDLAFSHEVIYLIEDLERHAQEVSSVLKPGAHYDAVTCCHSDNPLWASWRPRIAEFSNLPVPNHSVTDIVSAFCSAGLSVSVGRFLADAFIPSEPPTGYFPNAADRLDVYNRWKLCFRCTRLPGS